MSALTFYYPVLDALNRGPVIRKSVSIAIRVAGGLLALGVLLGIVQLLKLLFQPGMPAEATLAGLLAVAVIGGGTLCVVQICFYRAKSIDAIFDGGYTVVPIASILLRAVGEVLATLGVTAGLGGSLLVLLAGSQAGELLGPISILGFFLRSSDSNSSFVAAISILSYALLTSFAAILFFYLLAELLIAMADVARWVERFGLREFPVAVKELRCGRCGAQLTAESQFCDECGAGRARSASA